MNTSFCGRVVDLAYARGMASPRWISPDSGPVVARAFHAALGLIFAIAFGSLAAQIHLLFAPGGLAPIAETVAALRAEPGLTAWAAPSLFWWLSGDAILYTAAVAGLFLGLLAFAGIAVRLCLALATLLYLSFVSVGAPFLGFQWDSLLLECGLLAVLLPRTRPSPIVHLLFTFLIFKLYFESGLAKWYSSAGDWHDGSAMTYYYETAPLPGPLAWYMHQLPAAWHMIEGWLVLVGELLVPLLIFCGRRGRQVAVALLTGFQLVNLATANYGFFCHLALALHLFLLSDADLERPRRWVRRLPPALRPPPVPEDSKPQGPVRAALVGAFAGLYLAASLVDARATFSDDPTAQRWAEELAPWYAPLRMINTYHLFGQITRVRVEPELAGFDGEAWTDYALRYKPGPTDRLLPLVAPHQPRLDFQLWFYGLAMRRQPPEYVLRLLVMLCRDPTRAQSAFATPLLPAPQAVSLRFWRYNFSAPGSDAWWTRQEVGHASALRCADLP